MSILRKFNLVIGVLFSLAISSVGAENETVSLSGFVSLDATPALRPLEIEIAVRNHTFVVLPPPLGFLRPITSTQSTRVMLAKGADQIEYQIDNIATDTVNHSIQLMCIDCARHLPRQYYTNLGNSLALGGGAYLNPDELPDELDIVAITNALITGEVQSSQPASRDLHFEVAAVNAENPDSVLVRNSNVTLAAGTSFTHYTLSGIPRGNFDYAVQWQCLNCNASARGENLLARSLSPTQNHTEINILLTNEGVPILSPLFLLLEQEN